MGKDSRSLEQKIADRNAKLDELQAKLTSAVEALVTGDDWRRALTFAARFRSRSFNNTLLIWAQHTVAHEKGLVPAPAPTYVAGFQQWRALGRQVMKGQPGYQILAPVTARMAGRDDDPTSWHRLSKGEKPAPGEVVRTRMIGVRPAYVWDVSQTDGPPISEPPAIQLPAGQAPPGLWDGLAAQVTALGYDLRMVPDAAALDGASGRTTYAARLVEISADLPPGAQAAVLAHELAHAMLHAPGHDTAPDDGTTPEAGREGRSPHRGIREVEADFVAFMVAAAHGLDLTGSTVPYVSGWATTVPGSDPLQTVQSTAARVRTAAVTILERLETHQIPDGSPPAPSPAAQPDPAVERPAVSPAPAKPSAPSRTSMPASAPVMEGI
ncbi:ArdC-like ssDNA-binding domain-containing protein [Antribacter gilvus]|uniref:ArdC-like ssDNA-binding domain-containing protein n=1 Tax=Antribacter gilvus TaxID=2304675 RepID=UPI000F798A8E|nr:ArdC-like ssDNA-binding domain-containing protein [Antribacter gilvus]